MEIPEDLKDDIHALHRRRRLIFIVMMGIYMVGLFQRLCLGVVRIPLSEEFAMNAAVFGYLGGSYFNAYMLMQIPTGMLTDSWGPRKTFLTGVGIMAIGTILFSAALNLPMLFLGRILCGTGAAMLFIPIIKTISLWYSEKEFGPRSGLVNFLGYFSGFLAQAPLAYLSDQFGWRPIFWSMVGLSILFFLLNWRWFQDRPERIGLRPLMESDCRFIQKETSFRELLSALKRLITRSRTWPPSLIAFGVFGAFNALTGVWGVSYVSDVYGIKALEASSVLQFSLFGICLGSLVIMEISARLGKRKPLAIMFTALLTLCWLLLVLNTDGWIPLIWLKLCLFILGLCSSVLILSVVITKELHPTDYSGMSVSIYNVSCFLGGAVAAPAVGQIISILTIERFDTLVYRYSFSFCLALILLAFMSSLMLKETCCKNVGLELEGKKRQDLSSRLDIGA